MSPDERQAALMDAVVGWILLAGVLASAALLAGALLWQWVATGAPVLAFSLPGRSLASFFGRVFSLHGTSGPNLLADLGLAVLMLTPYLRVVASVGFFAFVEHDWKYTAFTTFVAALLTYSLFLR